MKKLLIPALSLCLSLAVVSSTKAQDKNYFTIKGSDTMVHLVSAWAEQYMKLNPGSEISVTGGGSGTGIAAFINGTTEVCMSSRKIKDKEIDDAKNNNVMPWEKSVALDGIAIAVNPSNPVKELTMEQIKNIYTGKVTNWKDVGGNDENIILLSRESSSGTYMFFMEHVLEKQDYAKSARLMPATSAIVQSISEDKGAIGYIGLGYAAEAKGKIKVVPVKKDAGSPAIIATNDTVKDGSYSISRPLFLYIKTTVAFESNSIIKKFVEFCLSEEGRKITLEQGYVPVN